MTREDPLEFEIRDYVGRDAHRLHQIDRQCFPPHLAYSRAELLFFLRHPDSIRKVADQEGRILGFAIGRPEGDLYGHIITLDVIPEARRRRVGTALLEAVHLEFRRRGVPLAVLEVSAVDSGAQLFYRGFGYQRVETLRGYYGARSDAHRMVLFLS